MSFFCAMQASATVVCKIAGRRLYKCTHKSTIKFQWLVVKLYNLPDNNICLFDQLCQRLLVRDVGLNWLRVLVASSQTFGFFEHVACYDGKSCFRCISFLLFFFYNSTCVERHTNDYLDIWARAKAIYERCSHHSGTEKQHRFLIIDCARQHLFQIYMLFSKFSVRSNRCIG